MDKGAGRQGSETAFATPHSAALQSIRGLAALTVALYHCSICFALGAYESALDHIFNSYASVLIFFVLSGFVLSLSRSSHITSLPALISFYLRRAARIYPALWLSIAVAAVLAILAAHLPCTAPLSAWANRICAPGGSLNPAHLPLRLTLETLVGKDTHLFLPIWTLYIELVGSLLIPFINSAMKISVLLFVAFMAAMIGLGLYDPGRFANLPLFTSLFFMGCGATRLVPAVRAVRSATAVRAMAVIGFAFCWWGRSLFGLVPDLPYRPVGLLSAGFGATLIVISVFARPDLFAFLSLRPIVRLGDISYSFYLLHMPVLGLFALAATHVFHPAPGYPLWLVAGGVTVLTLAVTAKLSALSFAYIEMPGVRIGKALIRRIVLQRAA